MSKNLLYGVPVLAIVAIILGTLVLSNQSPIRNPEGLPGCETVAPGTLCYSAAEDRAMRASPSVASPTVAAPTAAPTAAISASPTVAPAATPTATSAPAATATTTAAPVSEILPAIDLEIEPVDGEPSAFILHWAYPEEGEVAPESFDVHVDGELYESTTYEGTDFEYSWYVGDQPCTGPLDVQVIAVNGDDAAPSETVSWDGC